MASIRVHASASSAGWRAAATARIAFIPWQPLPHFLIRSSTIVLVPDNPFAE